MTERNINNPRPRSRVAATLTALLRTRITTGVLTILPVVLTLWVIKVLFVWMRDASQWVVRAYLLWGVEPVKPDGAPQSAPDMLQRIDFDWESWRQLCLSGFPNPEQHFFDYMTWYWQWGTSIISVLLTLFILYAIGLFAANLLGRRIIERLETFVDRVPLIKTVYRLPKQVITTFSATQSQNFRKAALIPFPQEKMRCVGFITNIFHDSVTGDELCSVFIPTTPNPTTGYLQVLKRKELTELDWSVEDAIRTIMSGGILKPDFLTIVPNKDLPAEMPHITKGGPLPPSEEPDIPKQ